MSDYGKPLGTGLSADQTIVRAYDEANNRHRVDAQVTATLGTVDVAIDAASGDNIAIRDADGNEMNVNLDGSINVIVQDITLSKFNDSIEVFQTNHDNLNANVNVQQNNMDVSVANPLYTQTTNSALETTQQQALDELQTIDNSLDNIETYSLSTRNAVQSIDTDFDTQLSTRASEATLSAINNKLNSLGQKTMAGSSPIVIASDQSTIKVNTEGEVAIQTTTNLGIAGIYTSLSVDTKDFGTIIVSSFSNVAGSFAVEWSIDQVTWRSDGDIYITTANVLKTSTYGPKYRYVRGVYTNGGTGQTTFEFQIVLKRNHTKPSSHKASEAFNDSTDLEGVKAVVAGKAPNGTYVNWGMTNVGSGKIAIIELDGAVANYGVTAGALRTASQIGNAAGPADFNSGVTGVQTLRTASNSYGFDGTDLRQISTDNRGHQNTLSVLNGSSVFAALTVGTSAVEIKVGGSPLANRKNVTLHNNSLFTLYWGYSNAVTTSTGTPIVANQFVEWDVGPLQSIYVIAAVAGNNTRITEGS